MRGKNKPNNNSSFSDLPGLEPLKKLKEITKSIPGFNSDVIISKIPKIIRKRSAIKMSFKIARGIAKRSVIRVLKISAGLQ